MRQPTKLQVFANFRPQKMLHSFITPLPSRFISDRLCFVPKLKIMLKGPNCADATEIQEAVTEELKNVQKEEFSAAFQKT